MGVEYIDEDQLKMMGIRSVCQDTQNLYDIQLVCYIQDYNYFLAILDEYLGN